MVIVFLCCNILALVVNLLEVRRYRQGYYVFCVVIVFFCCNILALVVNLLEVRRYRQGYYVFCVVIVFLRCNILALVVNLLEVREIQARLLCLLCGHCLLLLQHPSASSQPA